jgi:hypothetical protein
MNQQHLQLMGTESRVTNWAGLCRRFGLSPYSVRAIVFCGGVSRLRVEGRTLIGIEQFSAALLSPHAGDGAVNSGFSIANGPKGWNPPSRLRDSSPEAWPGYRSARRVDLSGRNDSSDGKF